MICIKPMFWTELVEIYCIQSKKLKSQVQLKFVMLYGVKIYIKNVDNILKFSKISRFLTGSGLRILFLCVHLMSISLIFKKFKSSCLIVVRTFLNYNGIVFKFNLMKIQLLCLKFHKICHSSKF